MVPPDCIGKIIGPKVSNDAYCIVSCLCMSSIHMIYTINFTYMHTYEIIIHYLFMYL